MSDGSTGLTIKGSTALRKIECEPPGTSLRGSFIDVLPKAEGGGPSKL